MCFALKKNGSSRFGDQCTFLHKRSPASSGGDSGPAGDGDGITGDDAVDSTIIGETRALVVRGSGGGERGRRAGGGKFN